MTDDGGYSESNTATPATTHFSLVEIITIDVKQDSTENSVAQVLTEKRIGKDGKESDEINS